MKKFSIDYINEHGADVGVLEYGNDYYTVVWLERDKVWVFGGVCNVGLLAQGYYDAEYLSKDEALQELNADLECLDRGEGVSGDCYLYGDCYE